MASSAPYAEGAPGIPASNATHVTHMVSYPTAQKTPLTSSTAVHVGCAKKAGWRMGFEALPAEGCRRATPSVAGVVDETHGLKPSVWCPEHPVQPRVHRINAPTNVAGQTALGLFVRTNKQADRSPTATAPKASKLGRPINCRKTSGMLPCNQRDTRKRCSRCGTTDGSLWWKAPLPSAMNGTVLEGRVSKRNATPPTAASHCNKCHVIWKERSTSSFSDTTNNGHQTSKNVPLPAPHD